LTIFGDEVGSTCVVKGIAFARRDTAVKSSNLINGDTNMLPANDNGPVEGGITCSSFAKAA